MALATRVTCNKESDGNSNEGNGNKGGRQAMARRAMAMATEMAMTWGMATAIRLVGNKEGKCKCGKGNGEENKDAG